MHKFQKIQTPNVNEKPNNKYPTHFLEADFICQKIFCWYKIFFFFLNTKNQEKNVNETGKRSTIPFHILRENKIK